MKARFLRWYMGRVAGRYCPCEWPIKSKRLIHLCGRIDDAHDRLEFRDFVRFWMSHGTTATTASSTNVTVSWAPQRRRHGR